MTSSLRNSLHRRNHKERSQLAHRSKLGVLEKHADYVKRARDYHSKQDRLTRLKQKVAERNKDEFYFSMTKERTKGGVHIQSRGNVALPTDIVKVLKTQDENYIRTMRASGLKKIDKIKNHLTEMSDLLGAGHSEVDKRIDTGLDKGDLETLKEAKVFVGSKPTRQRHILFAENAEEAARLGAKGKKREVIDEHLPTDPDATDDLGWKPEMSTTKPNSKKRKSIGVTEKVDVVEIEDPEPKQLDKRKRLLTELSARLERDKKLRYAQREFEMQRLMMGKGARKKIAGVEKVEGEQDSEEDEDEIDARKGRSRKTGNKILDEAAYKPRVYKWRLERRR